MRISNQQIIQIAKNQNTDLLYQVLAVNNASAQHLLTKEQTTLSHNMNRKQKSHICPSENLIFVKTFEKAREELERTFNPAREAESHVRNMCYDKPIEQIMDELTRYSKGIGIEKNKFRFVVENIDKDHIVQYESQYNEQIRALLNEDDLIALLTDPEAAIRHQEEEKQEEEEEEEYELC